MSPPSPRGILTLVNSGNSSVNKFQEKNSIIQEGGGPIFLIDVFKKNSGKKISLFLVSP
jgi:hypothetical protein